MLNFVKGLVLWDWGCIFIMGEYIFFVKKGGGSLHIRNPYNVWGFGEKCIGFSSEWGLKKFN